MDANLKATSAKASSTRRNFCAIGGTVALQALGGCALSGAPANTNAVDSSRPPQITVTLLGTGTPEPDPERFSAATLVEAGNTRLLFDAGRGATVRLNQLKVPIGSIDMTFLTHFHSDHTIGLPDLWLMGFLPFFGLRKSPMSLTGPKGTRDLAENMTKAYQDDLRIRLAELRLDPNNVTILTNEFTQDGVVFDKNGVKVTAFAVEHGEFANPVYGYRVDYAGKSVLISGDTSYSANVIKYGTGVDLLIHEVAEAPEAIKGSPIVKAILRLHTSPEECGQIFTLTRPKMAAYTHLALLRGPAHPPVSIAEVIANTRKTYSGPLVSGDDLTRFEIGDQVRVLQWDKSKGGYKP